MQSFPPPGGVEVTKLNYFANRGHSLLYKTDVANSCFAFLSEQQFKNDSIINLFRFGGM